MAQAERCEVEVRIRDLELQMEQLRAFLMSSYRRADGDASDPFVLEISERFDNLLNEWMELKNLVRRKAGRSK